MEESNDNKPPIISEEIIDKTEIFFYQPAKQKVDKLDIKIEKNKINNGYKFLYKKTDGYSTTDNKTNIKNYICLLQTFPFSNYDFKDESAEKCNRYMKDGANVIYQQENESRSFVTVKGNIKGDKENSRYNILSNAKKEENEENAKKKESEEVKSEEVKSEEVKSEEVKNDEILYDIVHENKILFLDNDLEKYYKKMEKADYEKFVSDNKEKLDALLSKLTITNSTGKVGKETSSENLTARNTFLEEIEKSSTTPVPSASDESSDPNATDKPPLKISCNIKKVKLEGGSRRRKRRTKKHSAKSRRRRRRRTMKKRKSKRTKKTRKNRKTKRVRFKL